MVKSIYDTVQVSRSGYYAWKRRPESKRELAKASLTVRIVHRNRGSLAIFSSF
ncbi:MAG: hypothetical protein K1X29_04390 [Bdellovibrionales bacterium]|nr:hypothetical protein [Bdellovibrionales bacterium]